MSGNAIINANPAVFSVTGGTNCGSTTVGLSGSASGINYQLLLNGSNSGSPVAGTGSALSFGTKTTSGTYTVLATNATSSCTTTMTGSAIVNTNPTISSVSNTSPVCSGQSIDLTVNGSNFASYVWSNAAPATSGQVYNQDFSNLVTTSGTSVTWVDNSTLPGWYVSSNVIATNGIVGGTGSDNTGNIYSFGASGSTQRALGSLASITTGTIEYGVNLTNNTGAAVDRIFVQYTGQQWRDGGPTAVANTLSFLYSTNATSLSSGTYTGVSALNYTSPTTTGSTGAVNGAATANQTVKQATITLGTPIAAGGTVWLKWSDIDEAGLDMGLGIDDVNVILYNSSNTALSAPAGNSATVSTSNGFTTNATYNVASATTNGSHTVTVYGLNGCSASSATNVTVNALPNAFSVTGGGSYCSGGTGLPVGLSGSQSGINYQLKDGTTNVGSAVAGTGSAISFGNQTTATTYTVVATNATTSCTQNMTGSATVTINALPSAVTVTGGTTQCGGTVTLNASNGNVGTIYYQGTTTNGTSTATASASQNVSATGTYYFRAQSTAGCWSPEGSAAVTINSVPATVTVTGGTTQCGGTVTLNASGGSGGTIYYQGTTTNGTSTATASASQNVSATGTYYFRAQSSAGCWGPEGSAAVTINSVPAAVTVTGGTTQCGGTVTLNASNGNSGTIYYQATTTNGTSTAIASASQNVSATGTYYFRAQSSAGCWGPEGSAAVTINTVPTAGATNGGPYVQAQTIALHATGAGTYSWSGPNGYASTSQNPTIPNCDINDNGDYTVTVISAQGCTATATTNVYVGPNVSIWTAGAGTTDWFTAGNWSANVPSQFISAVIPSGRPFYPVIEGIVGQTATTKDVAIQAGASLTVNCINGVNLEVYGSNWANDGNVSLGCGKVLFKGGAAQTIDGNNAFKNLDINNSQGVSITSGSVSVSGVVNLTSGTLASNGRLTIASSSAGTGLIDNFSGSNSGTISGNITVQRYADNANSNSFYYIGAPVTNATINDWNNDFSNNPINGAVDGSQVIPTNLCEIFQLYYSSPYGGLFDYRENTVTTCNLEGWHTRFSGNITPGQGFAGRVPNGSVLDLTGGFSSADVVSPALTRTATNTTTSKGFNLTANPYTAPIDWLDVAAGNTGIQGTAYVYESNGPLAGTYQPVNLFSGSTQIGTSQAFFVRVGAGTSYNITYKGAMRKNGTNAFLRTAKPYEQMLTLNVKGNNFADRAKIAFGGNFSAGFDTEYDAFKIKSDAGQPSLYVTEGTDEYSIYAQPSADVAKDVPVSLVPGASGTFTMEAADLETFSASDAIILEDLKLHTTQNLKENSKYTFTAEANDNAARFMIHFAPNATTTSTDPSSGIVITAIGNDITVLLGNADYGKASLDVVDVMGRKVTNTFDISNQSKYTLHLNDIAAGCYFVRLSGNGINQTQKVVLGNVK